MPLFFTKLLLLTKGDLSMLEYEFVQIDYSGALSPKEKRALEHQAAYSLLNKMLSAKGILDYEISRNENGKPYIDNSPIHFSISHTDGFCAVAICDVSVGIDCEKIDIAYENKIDNFSKRYFTSGEQNEIARSESKLTKFFEIWTRKEAYIKKYGLNSAEITRVDTTALDFKTVIHDSYVITIFK